MKIKLGLALLTLPVSAGFALTSSERETLIEALVHVESRGIASAIGDNGRAYGILQIHNIMVQDANRIARTNYTHSDMFEPHKARAVAKIILTHYDSVITRRTGNSATFEQLARVWNGGGSAWKVQTGSKEKNLQRYWSKVSQTLSKNK